MARSGGVAPSWHLRSKRTSMAHEVWCPMSLIGSVFSRRQQVVTKGLLAPERGITNARQLIGQRTRRLVVVAASLRIQRPALSATLEARSTLLAPWVSNIRRVRLTWDGEVPSIPFHSLKPFSVQ